MELHLFKTKKHLKSHPMLLPSPTTKVRSLSSVFSKNFADCVSGDPCAAREELRSTGLGHQVSNRSLGQKTSWFGLLWSLAERLALFFCKGTKRVKHCFKFFWKHWREKLTITSWKPSNMRILKHSETSCLSSVELYT